MNFKVQQTLKHKLKRCLLASAMLLFLCHTLVAQNTTQSPAVNDFRTGEIALKALAKHIQQDTTDVMREKSNNAFVEILKPILEQDNSFDYPFDSLKTIAIRYSPDKKLRFYTWVVAKVDRSSHDYYGFLQISQKKKWFTPKFFKLIELEDRTSEIRDPENTKLPPASWYGCLVYNILANKYMGKTYYTLLGWKANNTKVTQKVIDNLLVSSNNSKVSFGYPLFKDDKLIKNRVILRFNAQLAVNVHPQADVLVPVGAPKKAKGSKGPPIQEFVKEDLIIFDHVSPPDPMYEGQYEYYGPDFSFDGYHFEKGKWLLRKHVDVRNDKSKDVKPRITSKQAKGADPFYRKY